MASPVRTKHATATESFGIDYATDYLDTGETIVTSTWTVPAGITKLAESFTTTVTKIVLSGGTVGTIYEITNTITTNTSPPRNPSECIRILITQC